MPVQIYQDPYIAKDVKCTENWDIVLRDEGDYNRIVNTLENEQRETLMQVLNLCLRTRKGTHRKNQAFGAFPGRMQYKMTAQSLGELKSYILINLRNSWFNQKDYPVDLNIFPIGPDSVAIQIYVNIATFKSEPNMTSINFVFNQSTQSLKTVNRAFGV
jgi:hypothetical protein